MPSRHGPLRSLAELQLKLQSELSATYDTHALGLMGLSGAFAAAAIAGRDFLEHLWWVSMIGLFVAIGPCVLALSARELDTGLDPTDPLGLYEGLDEAEIDQVLVANLHSRLDENRVVVLYKRNMIRWALRLLGATVALGAFLTVVVS
jgi:hypothetical protein